MWDPSRDQRGGAGSGPFNETGNAHVAPPLVDLAGGDLRPRAGSPMIDRDSKTDGRFRDVDLRPAVDGDGNGSVAADAGAFEYRRLAPELSSADVPAAGTVGRPLAFAVDAADPDGDRTRVTWTFGDGATASGAKATHAYETAGNRTVAVTVTDELGLTTTRTFTVAVALPAQPDNPGQPGGGAQPGAGSQPGGGVGSPAGDSKAPKLKGLKLSARKARVGKAKSVKLRFALDEPARVSIVARRGKRSGEVTLSADEGKDKVKLAGALKKLGKLAPGSVSIKVSATDAAGNKSAPKTLKLKLSR